MAEKKIKITDLRQDENNFNLHTKDGMKLLKRSVSRVGVIESVTVSSDNEIISGNARQEVMSEVLENKDAIIVETDGTVPVIIKRTDIESGTQKFYEAALLANTVAKENINFDEAKVRDFAVNVHEINVNECGYVDEYTLFVPNLNPTNTKKDNVSDSDMLKAKRKIENKFENKEQSKTRIVCPKCNYEFDVKL